MVIYTFENLWDDKKKAEDDDFVGGSKNSGTYLKNLIEASIDVWKDCFFIDKVEKIWYFNEPQSNKIFDSIIKNNYIPPELYFPASNNFKFPIFVSIKDYKMTLDSYLMQKSFSEKEKEKKNLLLKLHSKSYQLNLTNINNEKREILFDDSISIENKPQKIIVKLLDGKKLTLEVFENTKISEIIEIINNKFQVQPPISLLMFNYKILSHNTTVYGAKCGFSVIFEYRSI